MALVYADAGALVTLCVPGRGSSVMTTLWNRADVIVTSRVAVVQVPAALAQARRTEVITGEEAAAALVQWQRIKHGLYVMEATGDRGEHAAQLADAHDLRADDAWHLAAAVELAHAGGLVAAGDERLAFAARCEGLTVVQW